MLTGLIFAAALTLQGQVPAAPPSTWDGVPGSDVVQIDPVTGEVTFPMGRQPGNALALGCVFGRANVRCPKGTALVVAIDDADAERTATDEDMVRDAFAWFAEGSETPAVTTIDWPADALGDGTDGLPAGPIDCVTTRPVAGERACTFEEALHNDRAASATADEPAEPSSRQSGCQREEYTYPDGTGGGVRLVCGSGDRRTIDALRESARPRPQ